MELTAAGTVRAFHLVPFSSHTTWLTIDRANIRNISEQVITCFEMVDDNYYRVFFMRFSSYLKEQWESIVTENKVKIYEKR